MRIPFLDSDFEDLVTILDDAGTEDRSFFDDDDEFDDEFGVKVEDDEEMDSHGFDSDEEEEPPYNYVYNFGQDYGDDCTNTITSSTNAIPAPSPVNHHPSPMGSKKLKKRKAFALLVCSGQFLLYVLCVLWFSYTKSIVTPQINVEMASVYPLQFTSVSNSLNVTVAYNVTAGWNINFAVTNPSKRHILSYSNLVATVYYKGNPTWVTLVRAFNQADSSLDFVHANFNRNPVRVDYSFALSVLKDISYGSASDFSVRLSGKIRQKMASDRKHSRGRALRAVCGLDVEFLPKAGLMAVATPKMCSTSVSWFDELF